MGDSARDGLGLETKTDKLPMEIVKIGNSPRYIIKEKLGEGGFGEVRVGESTGPWGKKVAIKFERVDSARSPKSPNEWEAYKALKGVDGVPNMHHHAIQNSIHITIMDLLGPSLRDLQKSTREIVTDELVKDFAIQALKILKNVHKKGYVHGDIKPANILLGPGGVSERKLFLTDFGLATRWEDDDKRHIEYDQTPFIFSFSGTVDYASVHTHLGRTRSRRDDLESLAYTLISLLSDSGRLPWHEHKGDDKKFLVCKDKLSISPERLCCGLTQPFRRFFEYVVELKFDEEPNYEGCILLFEGRGGPKRTIPKQPIRVRTGKPAIQWISVYDARPPMKQRYHYGVQTAHLEHFIEKGKEDKLFVSSVASCDDLWALIIDDGTGFSQQIHELLPGFPDETWLKKRWDEGYFITAIAGAKNGSSLIVMSKGTPYKQQAFLAARLFPYAKMRDKSKDGFYITSMATSGSEWAVVMSSSDSDIELEQVIELDFGYPSEGIHRRWAQGFQITATAATEEQAAFVFTKKPTDRPKQQDTYRTSIFPSKHVKEKWARNMYITSLCYGRTIS